MNQYIKKVWVVENDSCLVSKGTNPMIPDGCLEIIIVKGNGINIRIKNSEFKCTEGVYLRGAAFWNGRPGSLTKDYNLFSENKLMD